MGRGNIYLKDKEVWLVVTACDAMLDVLPDADVVPEVDREDARRDRASYESLRSKIIAHASKR